MSPLRADAEALLARAREGDIDHDGIEALTAAVSETASSLAPDEGRALYTVVTELGARVREARDTVKSQLGGVSTRSRAVRGFTRSARFSGGLRGQRVNQDV